MSDFISIWLPLIIVFNIVVFIHSAGHFIGARLFRVEIDMVSLGLGPKLYQFSIQGVPYVIRWCPIGGFVRTRISPDDDALIFKKVCVSLSGPIFNILIATGALLILFSTLGSPGFENGRVGLVDQSLEGAFLSAIRAIYWTWTAWSPNAFIMPASSYDTSVGKLVVLGAVWSSKFGLVNLLPLMRFDGWDILKLILSSTAGPNYSEVVVKWGGRIVTWLVLFVFFYWIRDDIQQLKTFQFFKDLLFN